MVEWEAIGKLFNLAMKLLGGPVFIGGFVLMWLQWRKETSKSAHKSDADVAEDDDISRGWRSAQEAKQREQDGNIKDLYTKIEECERRMNDKIIEFYRGKN